MNFWGVILVAILTTGLFLAVGVACAGSYFFYFWATRRGGVEKISTWLREKPFVVTHPIISGFLLIGSYKVIFIIAPLLPFALLYFLFRFGPYKNFETLDAGEITWFLILPLILSMWIAAISALLQQFANILNIGSLIKIMRRIDPESLVGKIMRFLLFVFPILLFAAFFFIAYAIWYTNSLK